MNRRKLLKISATALATPFFINSQAKANSKTNIEWKMVTSWPKNLPGPGITAQRLADRITQMSGGRLRITLFEVNKLVPAFEVFSAVSLSKAQMGHTASFFWQGKYPQSVFFTTIPFGLNPIEHIAWIEQGQGQQLWNELYQKDNLIAFMAGNTGMGMGGWYKKSINSLEDLKGLKIRMPGLGGKVLEKLGATSLSLPPSEIFQALEKGVIDAAEFLGPWSDSAFGFDKIAPYYYWPGYHKPNGTAECLINKEAFEQLPKDLQAIVKNATQAENAFSLAESQWNNSLFLRKLQKNKKVTILPLPNDILQKAKKTLVELLEQTYSKTDLSKRILASYLEAVELNKEWSSISTGAFLNARSPLK